ncbi:MAG: S-methyl-5'-thioadenosine phosphorylase [Pelolinea sp.]|nr:S-methyl-5'-thioadenosine phosphorylase [Pelolinea sp.]
MNKNPVLAVIGGSGLYQFPSLKNGKQFIVETPFGNPSSPITIGEISGKKVAFLARHGIGHTLLPTEVNSRANIYALKSIGATRIVSVSACGSLREDFRPGHIVIPDQLVDFTSLRPRSFFGEGVVAHIGTADPFCMDLSNSVIEALKSTGAVIHKGGTYITIEGPRFSTKAESNLFREWGMSIIGMTACPEAFLAREAEICYATMAHVTDYDVWHSSELPVTVEMVIKVLNQNTTLAQNALERLIQLLPESNDCDCQNILKDAIMTQRNRIPKNTKKKLGILVKKYL